MAIALDSGAVIAFLDRGDAHHDAAISRIRRAVEKERLVASVITFAEVLTGWMVGHHTEAVARGFFQDLVSEIVPVGVDVGERAAELRARRKSLRLPDALILATADLHQDVSLLVSGDQRLRGVRGLDFRIELLSASRH